MYEQKCTCIPLLPRCLKEPSYLGYVVFRVAVKLWKEGFHALTSAPLTFQICPSEDNFGSPRTFFHILFNE